MVKKETTRQIMQTSNELCIAYLRDDLNAQQIWLKPHYRYPTTTYMRDHAYKNQDIFNLFDGFCSWKRKIYGIQVKTNVFDTIKKHEKFQKDWAQNIPILLVKVDRESGEVTHKELSIKVLNVKPADLK